VILIFSPINYVRGFFSNYDFIPTPSLATEYIFSGNGLNQAGSIAPCLVSQYRGRHLWLAWSEHHVAFVRKTNSGFPSIAWQSHRSQWPHWNPDSLVLSWPDQSTLEIFPPPAEHRWLRRNNAGRKITDV
jgi:hypothetical protein